MHHPGVLLFLALHLVSSISIAVLAGLSAHSSQDSSHLLRHVVNAANLSSVIFRNPSTGEVGNWQTVPAVVVHLNGTNTTGDGYTPYYDGGQQKVCDDDGKKCSGVTAAHHHGGDQQPLMASSTSQQTGSSATATLTSASSSFDAQKAIVTTLTVQEGVAVTEIASVASTVTVIEGQALTTTVLVPISTVAASASASVSKVSESQEEPTSLATITSTKTGPSGQPQASDTPHEHDSADDDEEDDDEEDDDDDEEDDDDDHGDHDKRRSTILTPITGDSSATITGVDIAITGQPDLVVLQVSISDDKNISAEMSELCSVLFVAHQLTGQLGAHADCACGIFHLDPPASVGRGQSRIYPARWRTV